jgi:hypothetical protein
MSAPDAAEHLLPNFLKNGDPDLIVTEFSVLRAVPLVHHEMVIDHDNLLFTVDE